MHSHSFQDTELKLHRYVNDSSGQVVEGLTILRYPVGLRNKGLITPKTWIRHAFAQFPRYREYRIQRTLQVRQWLSGTGRGGVEDSTVFRGAQKQRVNHSKNVNSTCIRTVFKILSWNFTGTSMTPRYRLWEGWRFYGTPGGVKNKGLITQNT